MSETTSGTVRKRRVFYIPGYDPNPPRRYRELYRKEGAEQTRISGYKLSFPSRVSEHGFGWYVDAEIEGAVCHAEINVLSWSDLVRSSMEGSTPGTYREMVRAVRTYLRAGILGSLMKLRKGPVLAALYPVAMLVFQALLALVAGVLILMSFGMLAGYLGYVIGLVLGLGVGAIILNWFRKNDGIFLAYYLMHNFAVSSRQNGAYPPELVARLEDFGHEIAAAMLSDVDEVLVVGHSSGAHLAISVLANLQRAGRLPANGPAVGLLTLGQVVPMVSFLPDADQLRSDLRDMSLQTQIAWVDVTAPGDGCSFALCDPVAVSGVAEEGKLWPLVISAAFQQTLQPETWRRRRWRFFRLHFQYLCAFDKPGDYDYFRITAGPLTLQQRFKGRTPSKSRIETTVSKYTSVAA